MGSKITVVLKDFLYNKSIKGMTINKELEKKNKNPWAKSKGNEKDKENER